MLKHLRTILVLGRVSNLPTVWTNVMVGWFLYGGLWTCGLWWTMLGVSLLYVGGMTLNDAFDAEWDAKHAVERPIPSGAISLRSVWALAWGQMLAGVLVITGLTDVDWYLWLALVIVIVLYDWSHKRWKGAAFLMGLCRVLVYYVAASAVKDGVGVSTVFSMYALGLLFYVGGITTAARGESTGGSVGWNEKGWLLAPLMVGVFMLAKGEDRSAGLLIALGMFVLWLEYAVLQLKSTRPDRVGKFISALLAGIILVDLIALAQFGLIFWPICGGLLLLTLLAQRRIPAT